MNEQIPLNNDNTDSGISKHLFILPWAYAFDHFFFYSKFCIDSIERLFYIYFFYFGLLELSWKCCNWLHSLAPSSLFSKLKIFRQSNICIKTVVILVFSLLGESKRLNSKWKMKERKIFFSNIENLTEHYIFSDSTRSKNALRT